MFYIACILIQYTKKILPLSYYFSGIIL